MTVSSKPNTPPLIKSGKVSAPTVLNFDKPLDIGDIKTDYALKLKSAHQSFKKKIGNMKKSGDDKLTIASIDALVAEMDSSLKANKPHEAGAGKISMNGRQLLAQLEDLGRSTEWNDDEQITALTSMKSELEHILPIVLAKEAFAWYFGELSKFKSELDLLRSEAEVMDQKHRKEDSDNQLRQRVAEMKGYEDITSLRGDVMKKIELSSDVLRTVRDLLFHPVWYSRKLEKEFHVVVEKVGKDGCSIAGTAQDVDACFSRLCSFDSSGRKTVLVDGKTMGVILMDAPEIEKQFGVLLFAPQGSVELSVFGNEQSVGKAIKNLGSKFSIKFDDKGNMVGSDQQSISTTTAAPVIITERILCNSAVAKAVQTIGNLEEKHTVSVTLAPTGDNPRETFVVVRGQNEGVSLASGEIHKLISSVQVHHFIELRSKKAVCALFDAVNGFSSAPKNGLSEIKLAMRFNDLRKKASFFKVADDEVDIAVFPNVDPEYVLAELSYILMAVLYTTTKVPLAREHSRIWNEQMCALVSSTVASGSDLTVEITSRRSDESGDSWLEIWVASDSACDKAKELIEQVHNARIVDVPEEVVKSMLENRCQVLQSIQTDAVVNAYFDKMEMKLWFYGLRKNKNLAVEMFNAFVKSVHELMLQSTIKSIPIASDEIGRLIGPKGKTMFGIKERSDLEEIRISEQDRKVFLTGSNANIDHAISLIEEELSSRKDATVVQIGLAEDQDTVLQLQQGNSSSGAQVGGFLSGKSNDWNSSDKSNVPVKPAELGNADVFPTLGATATKKKNKW